MSNQPLALRLTGADDDLERLSAAVEGFFEERDLPPQLAFHFNLVLEELVTNALTYGYEGDASPQIDIALAVDGDRIEADVADNARPFDPLSVAAPDTEASLEDRDIGGLGIHFLRTLMEDVRYEREGHRNRLRFGKKI